MSRAASIEPGRLQAALAKASAELLAERGAGGHWVGELSASALSTATAVAALAIVQRESRSSDFKVQIESGIAWLGRHANEDGGWGDTILSLSNLSTTTLVWAAFGAAPGAEAAHRSVVQHAERWLRRHARGLEPDQLAPAIIRRYGKDRTFSAPILTLCALAGRLGAGRQAWRHVISLPFELAACPHQWFAALKLPVVSYALPALIAIGQARHHHRPTLNPIFRAIRTATRRRTLDLLSSIQPSTGGFLEATPLTSFVVMSLAGSGQADNVVTDRGVEFLLAAQRSDGSWPIDTNLATWVTTLAVNALARPETPAPELTSAIRPWLLGQQSKTEHPYTHAAPGGWAWTDLLGGVPDADDTAGALIALRNLGEPDDETRAAALAGVKWLLDLQNSDGGIPTFCRGWGALPFDRSSPDITAHAMRAWCAWFDELPPSIQPTVRKAVHRAVRFLSRVQHRDGSWTPLWFGNQFASNDVNAVYGTARVLQTMLSPRLNRQWFWPLDCRSPSVATRATRWLLAAQNADAGWGGSPDIGSSVEETALAVEALAGIRSENLPTVDLSADQIGEAVGRGTGWLLDRVETGRWREASPIGFYFAKLWYFERLYPMIFTVGALNSVAARFQSPSAPATPTASA